MKLNEVTACWFLLVNKVKPWLLQLSNFLFAWRTNFSSQSEFIISSHMRGLSQMQMRMPHISTCISMFLHDCISYIYSVHVSQCMLGGQWHHVAFCISRQHRLCCWRPGCIFMLYSGWCVYSSSVKQCLQLVIHEQLPMSMTQNNNHTVVEQVAANPRLGRFSTETPLENAD